MRKGLEKRDYASLFAVLGGQVLLEGFAWIVADRRSAVNEKSGNQAGSRTVPSRQNDLDTIRLNPYLPPSNPDIRRSNPDASRPSRRANAGAPSHKDEPMNQRVRVPGVLSTRLEPIGDAQRGKMATRALGSIFLGALLGMGLVGCLHPQTRLQKEDETAGDKDVEVRTVGDVTEVANVAPLTVSGVGLVTGLEGTGGGTPQGSFRTMLENELAKQKVQSVKEALASENNALVLVSAVIPVGTHTNEPLDVEVTLPPGSGAKSLRGGILQRCVLYNYDTSKNINPETEKGNFLLRGHICARASGPLLVGFGDGDEASRQKRAVVWGGGISLIDRPFYLTLKNDQQFARIANAVAERIKQTFRDDGRKRLLVLGQVTDQIGERFDGTRRPGYPGTAAVAKAVSREVVYIRVPWGYRLNPTRYLRVARLVPLQDSAEVHTRYRQRQRQRLLDPAQTLSAALRLEALGEESIEVLKDGLKSEHLLVRFAAAEALAYLGSPAGGEELARLVKEQPKLRAYALAALASLNESVCHVKLAELLSDPSCETRYGAFRALHIMDEHNPEIKGELLNESFWLHRLAPQSPPLIHVSANRRPEVVLFGEEPMFAPPFSLVAGEFTATAGPSDSRCTVARFPMHQGTVERRQCSLKVADVMRMLAELDGTYADATELLTQAQKSQCLSCAVRVNALPQPPPVEELAEKGKDPGYWKMTMLQEATAATDQGPGAPISHQD
jgi:hypothetical protein